MARALVVCLLSIVLFLPFAVTQNIPTSDPQAVAYASQSIAALTGGIPISDVSISANATWTVGSNVQTGTATLSAKGLYESRADLALSGGNRTEIRSTAAGYPIGAWKGRNSASHPYSDENCWTDADWFFPALTSLSRSDPSIVLSYGGAETRFGMAVLHLTSFRAVSADSQPLTQMDFYLDATTLLPVSVVFNAHPDNNPAIDIPVEVQFTEYQSLNGMQVPMHIQRFLQGSLLLDLQVTSISVNSGLQDSQFKIQ